MRREAGVIGRAACTGRRSSRAVPQRIGAGLVAIFVTLAASGAFAQPPDLTQMSGVPLPVADLPAGTVTVRVIRGSLANPVAGQDVRLVVGGVARTVKTNEVGRAEFNGLTPGSKVKASTTVGAEQLDSREFDVPATGGIRIMLVGAAPGTTPAAPAEKGAKPPAPPQGGIVTLGDQSRFVFEMGDEALTGFYILQVVNTAPTPINPVVPFAIDLPEGASQASILQGSSPQGTVAGRRLSIAGPFAPGQTLVQVAFTLPYKGGTLAIAQPIPVALAQVTLLVEKVGAMQLESPQIAQHREVAALGDTYILGQGPGIDAGGTLHLTLTGLPHAPLWPRNLALGLALVIVGAGVWASVRPGRATAAWHARREKLEARRERLFEQLAVLEDQHRSGVVDAARYAARRAELVRSLERVYGEMDEEAAA